MGDLHREEVAFFGRITAAFTHEVKNVLAIVKENAGLMEDFLTLAGSESMPHRERILRAISSIQEQADRGVELSNRLNRFAHTTDQVRPTFDLGELVCQLSILVQRFARLKEVEIKISVPARHIVVETNPVRCQLLLLTGLECCWNTGSVTEVTLRVEDPGAGEVALSFSCSGSRASPAQLMERIRTGPEWERLGVLVEDLRGRIEPTPPEALFTVVLPRS